MEGAFPANVEADEARRRRLRHGLALRLGAVLFFAGMGAVVKTASNGGIPIFEIIFFRCAFSFLPIGLALIWRRGFHFPATRHPMAHLRRAVVGIAALCLNFISLSMLPFSTAVAIGFTAPLFLTTLSGPVLGEHVGWRRWAATSVGFAGVAVMLGFDGAIEIGAVFALGAAFFTALAVISIRQLAHEPALTTTFYFMLAATIASLLTFPLGWKAPSPQMFWLLVFGGVLGGIAQMFLTQSLRLAPPALLVSLDYTHLIWASVLGYLLWQEAPSLQTILGGAIIVCAACFIVVSEVVVTRALRLAQTVD